MPKSRSIRIIRTVSRKILAAVYSFFVYCSVITSPYAAVDDRTYIPPQAFQYFPVIKHQQQTYFPEHPLPVYFPALIEHESCISLLHKRCWNPTSQLKTQREEGAGLGQLTRTYNKDGSIRFDLVKELKDQYRTELKELQWSTIYQRPDLQIRSMILLSRNNYRTLTSITDPIERVYFSDLAYNAGLGRVYKDRRLCSLQSRCNPQKWFGQVEKTCTASQKALYGNRSPCDISRHHVEDVIHQNLPKYRSVF